MSNDYETVCACLSETQRLLDISQECVRELRSERDEARRLLESSEAALQEAQRALFRWLPNRIGSEYDDLIAADAMTLMGLESTEGLREVGGEILIELMQKRRLLDDARAQVPLGWSNLEGTKFCFNGEKSKVSNADCVFPLFAHAAPVPTKPTAVPEARRLLDDARAQKPVGFVGEDHGLIYAELTDRGVPVGAQLYAAAPVPAQPAAIPAGWRVQDVGHRVSVCWDGAGYTLDDRHGPIEEAFCGFVRDVVKSAAARPQPAAVPELVRYCCSCQCVGEVDPRSRSCCPDAPGSVGYVSARFASRLAREFNVVRNGAAEVPEAVAKDAARYRFIRDENTNVGNIIDKRDGIHTGVHGEFMGYMYSYRCGADLDARIDAALLSAADTEVKK